MAGFRMSWRNAPTGGAQLLSGVAVCTVIAGLSMLMALSVPALPAVLTALVAGTMFAHRNDVSYLTPGADFTIRTILRIGIALIGVRFSVEQISELGISAVAIAAGGVGLMLSAGTLVAMAFGLPRSRSLLSAGAVGICGASAALAISTVLPHREAQERQTATTVALVTVLSTAAMLLYPLVGSVLSFGPLQAGIFFGSAIHDVTQVAGAGAMISNDAATAAIATKLVRVACLAPVVAAIAMVGARYATSSYRGATPPPVPFFLVGFGLVAAAANLGLLSDTLRHFLSETATFCLVAATAALGIKTSPRRILADGWRPLAAMLAQTLLLAAYAIGCILFLAY
ncbi:putative sulfate exporter family transporter [Sphingopyxis sp. DHUNG17]|uniref:YeiH family protein n=1 Tax=Sphingopyxis jiangsuensis TaxID=2871171 RepID=UPI00191E9073|nr:putative sulfate exporter family transporter [Sphingopyxis lutea]MBL0770068.1 putative sulfate exporter family transporter [Sphingopyxis lutea]